MFKLIATFCLSIAMLTGYYPKENNDAKKSAVTTVVATCYGYTPCNACSNCSQCKFCKNGGTCGKCEKKNDDTYKTKAPAPAATTQCKATTKSGSRCKRSAGSNGYCWQHG